MSKTWNVATGINTFRQEVVILRPSKDKIYKKQNMTQEYDKYVKLLFSLDGLWIKCSMRKKIYLDLKLITTCNYFQPIHRIRVY